MSENWPTEVGGNKFRIARAIRAQSEEENR